jgi:hypothetical protein
LQKYENLSLQQAFDRTGVLFQEVIDTFISSKNKLLAQYQDDENVKIYSDNLEYTANANIEWSFKTTRYFGKDGDKVKENLVIFV